MSIFQVTVLVKEYEEAIHFFVEKLGFRLMEDIALGEYKRWITVAPEANNGFKLVLAKAEGEEQLKTIGKQAGNRVFLFLQSKEFWKDYNRMTSQGIEFTENPRTEDYGTVVVFKDLYGNLWDLIQPA
ncbi:VOC family protein [Euzebyella saccharophila]|uniref:VOC family protein n=1 Tax=Euzebyella saccharophila TaxID=679664 RepID=A0ABV8JVK3_9FLAO|nr:VOC family protein [Euzebyella saccharophila]